MFAFLFFSTEALGGHLQLAHFEGRPDYFSGELARRDRPDEKALALSDATLDVDFYDDGRPRRFRKARFGGRLGNGREVEIETEALCPAVDMQGLGYSGGYDDGRGLGVWRGETHLEHEIWEVSHPTDVTRADGGVVRPMHRIQPVRVSLRGAGLEGEGTGSLTLIAEGTLPRLGLR